MENKAKSKRRWPQAITASVAALAAHSPNWAADTDIYAGTTTSGAPNVLFFLDNTSNWSAQNNAWTPGTSWNKCKNLSAAQVTACKAAIEEVFYTGVQGNPKRPWEANFNDWNSNQSPTQGQVELRALRLVLKELVCSGGPNPLNVNVGLSMFSSSKGSVINNGDPVAFIYHAVQPLAGSTTTGTCKALLDKLDNIDVKINDPITKAPSDANYGAALYEAFKYFGGHTNPGLVTTAGTSTAGAPVSDRAYGTQRFSKPFSLDDSDAYIDPGTNKNYKSPIGTASCGNNYLVLIGNTYPNQESTNASGGPPSFRPGSEYLQYTPPALSPVTSDTNRFADEWAYFNANTDISPVSGIQRLFTYTVNVYNAAPDAGQTRLMKSMAGVGGVGGSAYIEVGGDLLALVTAFKRILTEVAAVNSVFTAAALPISTATQGAYANQIFLGMFRPDANASPRWVGNLKQYQLGLVNGVLNMVDAKGNPAVLTGAGFITPLAESFWTTPSVFFTPQPSGTPPSGSDSPDGPIVEKGGVAHVLRTNNMQNASTRNVYTLPSSPASGALLSSTPFSTSNLTLTSGSPALFSAEEINWVRGENNMPPGTGAEAFNGMYSNSGTPTALSTTGARHSIHGDVLHARPLALNYGGGKVIVYYGSNDGHFRAIDGRQSGSTAGHELWSFVAPEHYPLVKRLRAATPQLQLPETNSAGATITPLSGQAPKEYGMDGPTGAYVRYAANGNSVTEAFIYPTMRRGGRSVYAFDVTSETAPSVMWKIAGGTAPWAQLAQTWSMPKPVVLRSTSATPPILLFMGGGYDPAEDQNNSSGIGNVVYVINGRTGQQIKAFTTDYSVPADILIIDANGDGDPDRAYATDVRGNIYRIDFPATGDLLDPNTWSSTSAVKIAALGGKMFYSPDVVVTTQFIGLVVGSGDREKPLLVSTSDKFFFVRDNIGAPRNSAITVADMTRVAKIDNATMTPTLVNPNVTDPEGCYIELATNGEKVVNGPFTIAGVTYFGTNRPSPVVNNACSGGLGEAYGYQFPLFCKPPTLVRFNENGMPPTPVGGIAEVTINGQVVKVPFLIGGGTVGGGTGTPCTSIFCTGSPTPPIPPIRSRLNWRVDNANR